LDLEFSSEQEQLRESVRRFLMQRAPLEYVRAHYDDAAGADDVWSGLADLGVVGLLVPEAHGGAGMGMVDAAVVLEEMGRAVYPGPFAASAIGAVSLVALAGSDDDQATLLTGLADGSTIGTVAMFEPARRAEWRAPATTAHGDGDSWRLDGAKVHVPAAQSASLLLVTATTDDNELGAFAVDSNTAEVEIESTPTIDGSRQEASVRMTGAPARRIGTGDASSAVAEVVDRLSTAAVVDGVGAASRALDMSVEYAKERKQFGVPIGSFQAVQHLCADMLRAVELTRAAGYYACWACDASPADRHLAATMALAFAADELYGVGAAAIQVHAGVGFTWEHDIHLFYKRLLTLQQTGGGSVDQLEELASIVVD